MTTALMEKRPDLQEQVGELKNQLRVVQEQLDTLLRGTVPLQVILPELHHPANGRLDAQKLATYMGIPLMQPAEGLALNYKAAHRNPAAGTFQIQLKPVKRCLDILHEFFGKPETVRVWLNTPHPDLGSRTALEMILAGKVAAVLKIIENAVAGVPV
jgi:uncharacterized protein (DUF2384 family)